MIRVRGYIFSRPFMGERVPQHIQNIVIKDYCKKKNILLLLSATEHSFSKSTIIIRQIVKDLKNYNGIVFYSMFQLPEDINFRKEIYKKIILQKKSLFFACEGIEVKTILDSERVENIWLVKQNQNQINNSINDIKKLCK
jgi:sporadic carbohydrate cluster protein (TIGR04323 family)